VLSREQAQKHAQGQKRKQKLVQGQMRAQMQ
jgi:hypothetical protein